MDLKFEHLLGTDYVPGSVHCWKLVRDFYRDNFGIELGDYAVPHDWNADKLNLIEIIYEREGFQKVPDWNMGDLRPADLLCVAVQSQNANHFLINLGDNQLLHHAVYQRSAVIPMRAFWRGSTCYVLRHHAVPDLRKSIPEVHIEDLIRDRYRVQAEA